MCRVAYYEMHGFNKIIIYDVNSTTGYNELNPWLSTGFVEIRYTWPGAIHGDKVRYGQRMRSQSKITFICIFIIIYHHCNYL